jgi:hypothetical protein
VQQQLVNLTQMILRKATFEDRAIIWNILQQAIEQRRQDGSEQWQQGYPSLQTVDEDILSGYGYVLTTNDNIIAYAAIIFGIEPAYDDIDGAWLTNGDYAAVHRVAASNAVKGKGIATSLFGMIEELCKQQNVCSIKIDTNFDNLPMLRIMYKLNYTYCGEIFFGGAPRRAYEKILHG